MPRVDRGNQHQKRVATLIWALILVGGSLQARSAELGCWPVEKAVAWGCERPWLVGCSYIPSTAINQLEMWQVDTFDLASINRELGLAEGLSFNSVRVFLHNLLWKQDAEGFLMRMEQILIEADRHKIGVVFVIFDGVWDPFPEAGGQRRPKDGVHNSGWVQSPGAKILVDPTKDKELKDYVTGMIGFFKADRWIHAWDLFNEPENPNRSSYGQRELREEPELAIKLLKQTLVWAREVNPAQPLTVGVWQGNWSDPEKLSPINRYMLDQSNVISFHNYRPLAEMKKRRCLTLAIWPANALYRVYGPADGEQLPPDLGPSQRTANWGL